MKSQKELYAAIQPLIASGDYPKAIEELEKLLNSYPDFAQGHFELGSLFFAMGDKQQAMEKYEHAVDLEPQNTKFLKSLADYYYTEKNDIDEAKGLYCRVIETDPQNVESMQILGNLSVVERDFETAKDYYAKVLDIEPWNHDALMISEKLDQQINKKAGRQISGPTYDQSQQLVQAGKLHEAIEMLEALIKDQPDFALAYNDLGVLYYQTDHKEKSLKYYEDAVRLEPTQHVFQKNLADFYFIELGRVEEALEIYFRVLSEEPTDIETLMATGYICKAIKRNDDAAVFFERVLDIEPWNFEASENLNQLNAMNIDFV